MAHPTAQQALWNVLSVCVCIFLIPFSTSCNGIILNGFMNFLLCEMAARHTINYFLKVYDDAIAVVGSV